jgi:DnaJ-class molecular chaperone
MKKKECYEKLGISVNSSDDDVKKAFKKLAMIHHPDRGGNEKVFKEISQAQDTIMKKTFSDDDNGVAGFGFDPFEFFQQQGRGQPSKNDTAHVRAHAPVNKQTIKLEKTFSITIKEAFHGTKKTFCIRNEIDCNECTRMCHICNGHGKVIVEQKQQHGFACFVSKSIQNCTKCRGSGKYNIINTCIACSDKKKILIKKTISLDIKPQFKNGYLQTIKNVIDGMDLHISIIIEDDEQFQMVDEGNLNYTCSIDFIDTIFGKNIKVNHPSGESININTLGLGEIMHQDKTIEFPNSGLTENKKLFVKFKVTYPKLKKVGPDEGNETEFDKCKDLLRTFFII